MQETIQLLWVLAQALILAETEAMAVLPLLRTALIIAQLAAAMVEEVMPLAAMVDVVVEQEHGARPLAERVLELAPIDMVTPEEMSASVIRGLEAVEPVV
jgi:hypothetical protein